MIKKWKINSCFAGKKRRKFGEKTDLFSSRKVYPKEAEIAQKLVNIEKSLKKTTFFKKMRKKRKKSRKFRKNSIKFKQF